MKNTKQKHLIIFQITGVLIIIAVACCLGVFFQYRYDIIDDVLMKDILSGVYSGTPEAHNAQNLYPLGLFLGLLYRMPVTRHFDWYGAFLLLCQYGSIILILRELITAVYSCNYDPDAQRPGHPGHGSAFNGRTLLTGAAALISILCVSAGHLVMVQYSFTAAMLVGAAVFITLSRIAFFCNNADPAASDEDQPVLPGESLPVVLVWIAFMIRSEMTLLMLPLAVFPVILRFIGASVAPRVQADDNRRSGIFIRNGIRKMIMWLLILAAGLILLRLWDAAAYSGSLKGGWYEFRRFFDARTELYDFQYIPNYEENRDFYESIGLSAGSEQLLVNYNFGLDEDIDADILRKVAAYADGHRVKESIFSRIRRVLPDYFYRLRNIRFPSGFEEPISDAPWNIIAGILCLWYILIALYRNIRTARQADNMSVPGKTGVVFRTISIPAAIFVIRSGLWMFLLVRGRAPMRVTHGLYFVEIMVWAGLIISEFVAMNNVQGVQNENGTESDDRSLTAVDTGKITQFTAAAGLALLIISSLIYIPVQLRIISEECSSRDRFQEKYEELYAYMGSHPDSFYLMDVYTGVSYDHSLSVTYSERMFHTSGKNTARQDGSSDTEPESDRIAAYNHDLCGGWFNKSPAQREKLLRMGLPASQGDAMLQENVYFVTAAEDDISWMEAFYSEQGTKIQISLVDVIGDVFAVYGVTENLMAFTPETVHVKIEGMKDTVRIGFLSDLHIVVNNEEIEDESAETVKGRVTAFSDAKGTTSADQWPRWVQFFNEADVDYLLLGGDLMDFASIANREVLQEGLDALQVPYMFIRADHDTEPFYLKQKVPALEWYADPDGGVFVHEFDDFTIAGWDNSTSQLTADGYELISRLCSEGKPVILLTHVPIEPLADTSLSEASRSVFADRSLLWGFGENYYYPEGATRDLLRLIYEEDTAISEVLSGHLHFSWDGQISPQVHEHVFGPAFSGCYGVIIVGAE